MPLNKYFKECGFQNGVTYWRGSTVLLPRGFWKCNMAPKNHSNQMVPKQQFTSRYRVLTYSGEKAPHNLLQFFPITPCENKIFGNMLFDCLPNKEIKNVAKFWYLFTNKHTVLTKTYHFHKVHVTKNTWINRC